MEIGLRDINLDLVSSLSLLSPFGKDNPEPVFASYGLFLKGKPRILGRNTLKFWVSDGEYVYPAIGFGMEDMIDIVNNTERFDLAYSLSIDSWQDNNQIQLELKDIRPSFQ
jgi:single-stranded-DNA-specific exonuclease